MSENPAPVTFEICPVCSQRTASHLFRQHQNLRCCFLCAQRAAEAEQSEAAIVLDRRYHGFGWIWKHALRVVATTIVLILLRMAVLHLLMSRGD